MKRLLLMLLVCAVPACGPSDENRKEAQLRKDMDKFLTERHDAVSGTQPGGNPDKETILEYREAKEDGLLSRASGLKGEAGKLIQSDLNASKARRAMLLASIAWTDRSGEAYGLISAANSLGQNVAVAAAYDSVTFAKTVQEGQAALDQLKQQQTDAQQQVQTLSAKATELQQQLTGYRNTATSAAQRADSLSSQAFLESGEAQYNLSIQAEAAREEANRANANADNVRADLETTQAMLNIREARSAGLAEQIASVTTTLNDLNAQQTEIRKIGNSARTDAEQIAQADLRPGVEALAAEYDAEVLGRFQTANESMEQATGLASGAHAQALQIEWGQMRQQQWIVENAYAALLKQLQEALTETQAELAKTLGDAAATVAARAAETSTEAVRMLTEINDSLKSSGESATSKDPVVKQLLVVNEALASLTGDAAFTAAAATYRAKINSGQ